MIQILMGPGNELEASLLPEVYKTSIASLLGRESLLAKNWQDRLDEFQPNKPDMNRLIMDYLVTEGFKDAAEKFRAEAGVEPSVALDTLDTRILIRAAVLDGRVQQATHLVNQLHPKLLDNDRQLYFNLQQQLLIEMIREGRIEDALTIAQKQALEAGATEPDVLDELEHTLMLLLLEKPQSNPFAELMEQSRRQKVAAQLNAAILKLEQPAKKGPRISNLLKLTLWAQEELDKRCINYQELEEPNLARIDHPEFEIIQIP